MPFSPLRLLCLLHQLVNQGMDDWDQETLEKVVKEKHGSEKPSNATNIICRYFLDAVEKRQYGWFWKCPNGADCKYRSVVAFGWVHVDYMLHPVPNIDIHVVFLRIAVQPMTEERHWQCFRLLHHTDNLLLSLSPHPQACASPWLCSEESDERAAGGGGQECQGHHRGD